jgi:gamma-glutamylaminecyclotransferase
MKDPEILVFVYGTLKKGFSNDKFLESSEFIGKAYTKNKFPMYIYKNGPYPFPYMLNKIGENKIIGEVYKISKETLEKLDWLEGCPDFYFRKEIKVIVDTKDEETIMTAFCYFLTKENEPFDQMPIPEFN